ncbi:hypothetical protein Tco_0482575 [Tanacetum coccineum]
MQHSGGYPRRAPTKARLASARRTEPRASSKRNRGAPHEGDGDGMLFLHRAGMRSTPRRPPHLEAWGSPPVGVNTPGGRRGAGSRDATSLRLRKFWAYAVTVGAGLEGLRKREALQAKKVESFKASKTESSSALRSKTPTKRYLNGTPSLSLQYPKYSGLDLKG